MSIKKVIESMSLDGLECRMDENYVIGPNQFVENSQALLLYTLLVGQKNK